MGIIVAHSLMAMNVFQTWPRLGPNATLTPPSTIRYQRTGFLQLQRCHLATHAQLPTGRHEFGDLSSLCGCDHLSDLTSGDVIAAKGAPSFPPEKAGLSGSSPFVTCQLSFPDDEHLALYSIIVAPSGRKNRFHTHTETRHKTFASFFGLTVFTQ